MEAKLAENGISLPPPFAPKGTYVCRLCSVVTDDGTFSIQPVRREELDSRRDRSIHGN